jgi:hypothetical protein
MRLCSMKFFADDYDHIHNLPLELRIQIYNDVAMPTSCGSRFLLFVLTYHLYL